jgi:hypothetical protein
MGHLPLFSFSATKMDWMRSASGLSVLWFGRWCPVDTSADRAGRRNMVLHEPLKELVHPVCGEEGHGASLLSAEIKRRNLLFRFRSGFEIFCCGE